MDVVQQLRIFVAVVDNGSFARAAGSLRMGRPAVTNAVAALEAAIGARLLHRTTRRSNLTGEGEIFYERAVGILADLAEAQNLFAGAGQVPRGRLRADVPVALARSLIIPRLPEFADRYPGVEIILGVSDQPVDLLADGVDCVLRMGELSSASMVSRVVAWLDMVTCASPSYLDTHGMPRTLDDLAAHRAVIYFAGRGRAILDWNFIEGAAERTIRMRPAIQVNDTEAFIGCAIAGLGMVQAIGVSVKEHLDVGRLVRVLPDHRTAQRPVSIMYPSREHLAHQVRAFIDWVAAILSAEA